MSRFRVVEVPGCRGPSSGGGAKPGISVHVQDTAYGYRIMGSWQSEQWSHKCGHAETKLRARRAARELADRLNEEYSR